MRTHDLPSGLHRKFGILDFWLGTDFTNSKISLTMYLYTVFLYPCS